LGGPQGPRQTRQGRQGPRWRWQRAERWPGRGGERVPGALLLLARSFQATLHVNSDSAANMMLERSILQALPFCAMLDQHTQPFSPAQCCCLLFLLISDDLPVHCTAGTCSPGVKSDKGREGRQVHELQVSTQHLCLPWHHTGKFEALGRAAMADTDAGSS
jgi:hypothetical protein